MNIIKHRSSIQLGWLFFIIVVLVHFFFSSCTPTKNSYYFKTLQKDTTIGGFITNNFETKIRKGDQISIFVSSLSQSEDNIFNQGSAVISTVNPVAGFTVGQDGNILFHKLGSVKAEGLSLRQLKENIREGLSAFMKDIVVNARYLNRKVTVLGEVNKPSVLALENEVMPVIDALVLSGDVTKVAKRTNIMIVREEGDEKKIKHLNLEDHSVFSSSWYYLHPNDIVYVFPDQAKIDRDERRKNIQSNLALAATGVSLLVIILDRIIK